MIGNIEQYFSRIDSLNISNYDIHPRQYIYLINLITSNQYSHFTFYIIECTCRILLLTKETVIVSKYSNIVKHFIMVIITVLMSSDSLNIHYVVINTSQQTNVIVIAEVKFVDFK